MSKPKRIGVGSVCKCSKGKIGVVKFIAYQYPNKSPWEQRVYHGNTMTGKAWQSTSPTLVAANLEEYIQQREHAVTTAILETLLDAISEDK